ncbi:MAG: lysophospholipid acyltransferase family protein [Bacteroidota bacterium]
MELITPSDFSKASGVFQYPGGERLAALLFRIMKLDKINRAYGEIHGLPAAEFIDAVIRELGIAFNVAPEEYANIPAAGPFITISNHAYGGIDGIILLKILPSVRPDFKVLMNFLLAKIKPIESLGIKVNPFEKIPQVNSSYGGLKEALLHLKNGHPVGLFPAGEVASLQLKTGNITDKKWPHSMLKLIRSAQVPVVPVYFSGHNSMLFNLLGMVHPMLRTARLPAEMYNKAGKEIRVRIGRPVLVREQAKFKDISELGRYLRMRTYSLGIEPEKHRKIWHFSSHASQPLILPVLPSLIAEEIENLKAGSTLFSINENFVFCASPAQIPNIMVELGRLREITYREVGEGTGSPCDLDGYDQYYDQLFMWDDLEKCIMGGYRVGYGRQIMEAHGIKGFYINTLFHIKDEFSPILKLSIELGRSFIVRSYQKKPLSLFLLWKGIHQVLFTNPEYRYLIGPVSISNEYRELSKALTVEFLKKNYFNKEFAAFFTPRKKFIPETNPVIKKRVFHKVTGNKISMLDNFIQAFDPAFQTPVLLKKYLSINSEVIGFNVDPMFNNCLDVLIITDTLDIPEETIRSLSKVQGPVKDGQPK